MKVTNYYIPGDFVSVGIKAGVGSVNENSTEKGYSHFVEHMMFKKHKDKLNEVKGWGGSINAYTSFDHTYYYITCLKEFAFHALDLITIFVTDPDFSVDFEKEKTVILNEIQDFYTDKECKLHTEVVACLDKSEVAVTALGTEDIVKAATPDRLREFYEKSYTNDNMEVIIVGDYDIGMTEVANIEIERPSCHDIIVPKFDMTMNKSYFSHDEEGVESNIMMRIWTPAIKTMDEYLNLRIASSILSDGLDSILFKQFREEDGLCYAVSTSIDTIGWSELNPKACIFYFDINFMDKSKEQYITDKFNEILGNFRPSERVLKDNMTYLRSVHAQNYVRVSSVAFSLARYGCTQREFIEKLRQPRDILQTFQEHILEQPSITGVYYKEE